MRQHSEKLIVALDVDTFDQARKLVDELSAVVEIFKVGSQLFTACGPVVVRHILAKGKKVFLDLKYHDIPNTVANAVKNVVGLSREQACLFPTSKKPAKEKYGCVFMCTVHTLGGKEMLTAAVRSAKENSQKLNVVKPLILGISVLTSDAGGSNINKIVLERAELAKESGLDGVVASSREALLIRKELGKDFLIVTPGIRPQGEAAGDQKRITTPYEAIINGSNYIVVGRPIIQSPSPMDAVQKILEEIKQAVNTL